VVDTMTAIHDAVPIPIGATETSDWADIGTPTEFRSFAGPIRTIPNLFEWDGGPATVAVNGTQLTDGTVEERFIRVDGLGWDDMLTAETARALSTALAEAADDLDRLEAQL
jgi:hypothetical protein